MLLLAASPALSAGAEADRRVERPRPRTCRRNRSRTNSAQANALPGTRRVIVFQKSADALAVASVIVRAPETKWGIAHDA